MKSLTKTGKLKTSFQQELFCLLMDALQPWTNNSHETACDNGWKIANATHKNNQIVFCVINARQRQSYTALFCCEDEPEIIAISHSDDFLAMLNPYLEGGGPIEAGLDDLHTWNILSVTFKPEKHATAVRYRRGGEICTAAVNEFGYISIIDWKSNQPVDQILEIEIDGNWRSTASDILPYTLDYVVARSKRAVSGSSATYNEWTHWLTSIFTEMGTNARAQLQYSLMAAFASGSETKCTDAFVRERKRFLKSEQSSLQSVFLSA